MRAADVLADGFERVHGDRAPRGRRADRAGSSASGWTAARTRSPGWSGTSPASQDDHVADVAGTEQVWTGGGWAERFALPFDPAATGYGGAARRSPRCRSTSGDLLLGYLDAVHEHTLRYVAALTRRRPGPGRRRPLGPAGDPRRPAGQRHLATTCSTPGQAAYVRGLVQGP